MKKLLLLSTTLFLLIYSCTPTKKVVDAPALPTASYMTHVENGAAALKAMKYDSCMVYFKQAFLIKQTSYLSTMRNCACAHSAGDLAYRDQQLTKTFDLNWGGK